MNSATKVQKNEKTTAIYCRISTEMQSIDRQKEELLKFATGELHTSVSSEHIYIDVISGFKKGDLRPAYSKMKTKVETGEIGTILFSEFTRMSRTANDLLKEIEYYRKMKVTTYFLKQNLWIKTEDEIKTPLEKMASETILHMLAVMAQYEIELFDERVLSGKITKITMKNNGGGLERAYGYMHNEKKEIIINEKESPTVERIFNMYANGYSSIQICEILNSEHVPSPYANRIKKFQKNRENKGLDPKEYKYFNVEELKWRPSSLNRILHNELYIGKKSVTMYKPDPTNTTPRHKRKDRGTPILEYNEKDERLRIISDEVFEQVEIRLQHANYNKNNAIKHDNLLKAKLVCGECGSNFSVGKQSDTATKYKSDPRTYKCYGRVNRKDKPQTCKSGAEIRQWKLDGLVLTLSLRMFAEINITETNENRIKKLSEEIADAEKVRNDKQRQLEDLDSEFKKVIKRLSRMKGEAEKTVREVMDEAGKEYESKKSNLSASIEKKQEEITSKSITITRLKKLAQKYTNLNDKMEEIWSNKELVKSMIDEYIDKIVIYKIHPMWNLVIVKYYNEYEFWGTIKAARYRNDEMFYDDMLCRHGIEFQAWVLNNSNHCFTYDKEHHTISYNGKEDIYSGTIPKGTYTYDELDKILHDTKWIGSYPFYDYENKSENTTIPTEPIPDFMRDDTDYSHIDWRKHNEEVLKKLTKKKK